MKQRNKWCRGMAGVVIVVAMLGSTGCSTVVEDVEPDGVSATLAVEYIVHEDTTVTAIPDITLWYTYPDVDPEPNGFLWFHGDTEVNQVPGNRDLLEEAAVELDGLTLNLTEYDEIANRASFRLPEGTIPSFTDGDDIVLDVSAGNYEVDGAGWVHLPEFVMLRIPAIGAVRSPGQSVVVYRFARGWDYFFYFQVKYPDYDWYSVGMGQHLAASHDDAHEWWFDLPSDLAADSVRLIVHQYMGLTQAEFTRAWAIVPAEETP